MVPRIVLPAAVSSDALLNVLYIAAAALVVAFVVMVLMRRRGPAAKSPTQQGPLDRAGMLQSAFDRAGVGIGFVTGEGQWLEVNKKLLAQVGYSRAEMTTVPLRFLTHPEDRKRESTLLADLRSGKRGGYSITKRLMRKGGEYRSARVHMSRIAETPQVLFQCTVDDSAQHLSQVETMSLAMSDVLETAVILCDSTGIITGWNKGAERIFGYAAEEVLGSGWMKQHASETKESLTRLVTSAAQNGFARSLNKRHRNDGATVLVRSVLIADLGRGDTSGFIEICHEEQAAAHTAPQPVAAPPQAEEPPKPSAPASTWRAFAGRQLPQLLTQIAAQSRSGVLQVRAAEGQKRFVFEQGQLIACSSSGNDRLLGQLLVDAGVIEEEHRIAALDTQRAMGTPFGTSVVTVGPASEDDVAEVIRTNAKNEIADVAGWETAEWTFGPDSRPISDMVPIAIDVRSILAEAFPQSHPAPAPAEETEGPLLARANAKKRIYHAAGCSAAKNIPRAHRLYFESASEAEAQNFRPCNRCLGAATQ